MEGVCEAFPQYGTVYADFLGSLFTQHSSALTFNLGRKEQVLDSGSTAGAQVPPICQGCGCTHPVGHEDPPVPVASSRPLRRSQDIRRFVVIRSADATVVGTRPSSVACGTACGRQRGQPGDGLREIAPCRRRRRMRRCPRPTTVDMLMCRLSHRRRPSRRHAVGGRGRDA